MQSRPPGSSNRCDGLLLLRGRDRIAGPDSTAEQPSADTAPARRNPGAGRVPRHANQVATSHRSRRPPAGLGPDPRGGRTYVRQAGAVGSRHRCPLHPTRSLHLARADARHRRVRPGRGRHIGRVRRRSPCWWSRSARRSPCSGSGSSRPQPRAPSSRSTPTGRSARSRRTESRSGSPERFWATLVSPAGRGSR